MKLGMVTILCFITVAPSSVTANATATPDSDSDELTRSSRTYNRKRKIIYTRGGPKDGPNQRPAWKKVRVRASVQTATASENLLQADTKFCSSALLTLDTTDTSFTETLPK